MNSWDEIYAAINRRELGFVRHKTWGVGVVTKGDHQFLWVDFPCFNKFGHKIDLEFSRKILEPLPAKSCLVSAFDERSPEFKKAFLEHPAKVVRTILAEVPTGELSDVQLREQLRMIRHGLGLGNYTEVPSFETWWRALQKSLEADPCIQGAGKPISSYFLIEEGTKHGAIYEVDETGQESLTPLSEGVEVFVSTLAAWPYSGSISERNGKRYLHRQRVCFSPNFIVPVITLGGLEVDVSDALPDGLKHGDMILLQRDVSESAIESVANQAFGPQAKVKRQIAAQWRQPVSKLTDLPTTLAAKMAAIGEAVSETAADNWLRGRLKIAPQPANLRALGTLCSRVGLGFDVERCLLAAAELDVAHRNAGRSLAKTFRNELPNILKSNMDALASGMTVSVGKQKITVDFYKVVSVTKEAKSARAADMNKVVEYEELYLPGKK
jgi:hypothetical protein